MLSLADPAVNYFRRLPNFWPTHVVDMAFWWRHMPIYSIWRLSTTLHMLRGDVGTIPCWVRASATAQWCHFQPSSEAEFQKTSQILASMLIMWPVDGFICPSTAYDASQAPCICWEGIWEPFHVGLEPQPLHHGVICSSAVNQNFRRLPKSWPIHVVDMAWWWLHMPIHSIWSLSTIFHMLGGDIWTIPCWVRASATAQWQWCPL